MAGRAPGGPGTNKAQAKPKEQQFVGDARVPDLHERIRCRANEIFLERSGQSGSELDDWLQAEREILAEQQLEKKA